MTDNTDDLVPQPERVWIYTGLVSNGIPAWEWGLAYLGPDVDDDWPSPIEFVRADLAAPKVKPLEWDDFEGQGAKASGFYQASYLITAWRGEFEVAMSYPGYQTKYDGERFHPTIEAAKAAAQADFEAKVWACLE